MEARVRKEGRRRGRSTTCKRWRASGCTECAGTLLRRGLPIPLAGALLLAAAGCVSAPDISITSVDVVAVGEEATELSIRIDLENPNDVPVKLDMWDYRLTVGSDAYSGRWSAGITVPPKETATASIPAVIPNAAAPGAGSAWRTRGSVTFLAPSRLAEVLFELGLNRPTASFSGNGPSIGAGGPPPSAG